MRSQISDTKIQAALSLLDDEDPGVFQTVSKELIRAIQSDHPDASEIMRVMVQKKNEAPDRISSRIEELIDEIQFQKLSPQFLRGFMDNASLETYAFLVMQIGYPDVDLEKYRRELQRLESLLRIEYFTSTMSEIDKIFMMSVILFEKEGYRGNTAGYYEPDNSYLNRVIDRKLGIPITLGAIYLILAERFRLPVFGVNMPGHFLLKYETPGGEERFIDPFNQGRILDKQDCIRFLQNQGYGAVDQYFSKASSLDILERMLNNLRNSYREMGHRQKTQTIERYLSLILDFRGKPLFPPSSSFESDDLEEA
ncbi:MAG: transglutaminase-like domain-containing protein [Chloroherpetonaceae bacterium]|nr:transglutaminase-like domain-containing protein [Chloroherpetonaceae bacterium]MCS7210966.1 transglutaminase-like domain-containing protein [Chloroherpetonaceae bacterium]MDW8020252.1 transglutaminase-like domain-containing protein [Chloroherpetonaceae bacterium]